MNTLLLNADSNADLALCGSWLKAGKLVAVPTETVYGLAADASNPDAVSAIFTAKRRPANHPLIVHLYDKKAINDWACKISTAAYALAEAFWPGPLTLLLHKAAHVSPIVTGGLNTIALRMPSHPLLLKLMQQHQLALAAPSANLYKKLSPTSAAHVVAGMQGKITAVLDGGDCQFGVESTIIDFTQPSRLLYAQVQSLQHKSKPYLAGQLRSRVSIMLWCRAMSVPIINQRNRYYALAVKSCWCIYQSRSSR